MTVLSAQQSDITALSVGAIVNAANPSLLGGGGVDGAIHEAGGPRILEQCREIVARQGECAPGEAVATGAGELDAAIIIHTVGPIWDDAETAEHDETLARCYQNSLQLAAKHNAREIAFPNISTGIYKFPKVRAASVAVNAIIDWLESRQDHSIEEIIFVCYDDENYQVYSSLLG